MGPSAQLIYCFISVKTSIIYWDYSYNKDCAYFEDLLQSPINVCYVSTSIKVSALYQVAPRANSNKTEGHIRHFWVINTSFRASVLAVVLYSKQDIHFLQIVKPQASIKSFDFFFRERENPANSQRITFWNILLYFTFKPLTHIIQQIFSTREQHSFKKYILTLYNPTYS